MCDHAVEKTVVIDCGSGMCKAGFAGDPLPRAVFPSIVGTPKPVPTLPRSATKDTYVGDEARTRNGVWPVQRGIVTSWDGMEKIWHHTFYNELRVAPEEHPVLLTEAPLNPKANREKMTQVMFETFHTPGVYIGNQGVLDMYACGKTTGIVLDSGDGVTNVVPVYEGCAIPHDVRRLELGGTDLSDYIIRSMRTRREYAFTTRERYVVEDIKERACKVALDYAIAIETFTETQPYKLPDGNTIQIAEEMVSVGEAMFNPSLIGSQLRGIHEEVFDSLQASSCDVRPDMYRNIVLAGGNTMFPGLDQRLKKELAVLMPEALELNVEVPADRKYSAWIGGSVLASLNQYSTVRSRLITKSEYQEEGPSIVNRKCF